LTDTENKSMAHLSDADRKDLLELARSAITARLKPDKPITRPDPPSEPMMEMCGCFVTLHKMGKLRGCIGIIEPKTSLVAGIEENAVNAAFGDPRFSPLMASELAEIDIEISVLTHPRILEFKDAGDLRNKLKPGVHGVILSRGWQRATFLPQVWDQLPDLEEFLGHLCNKANMEWKCYLDPNTTLNVYEVEYFSETP
jgi:AmmeMemoRadiSam system protein A